MKVILRWVSRGYVTFTNKSDYEVFPDSTRTDYQINTCESAPITATDILSKLGIVHQNSLKMFHRMMSLKVIYKSILENRMMFVKHATGVAIWGYRVKYKMVIINADVI